MSLLGFIYLVVIIGWIFLVLLLKCKKSMTPHISLQDNYANTMDGQRDQRQQPTVHVIQLQRDETLPDGRLMETYPCQSRRLSLLCHHSDSLTTTRSAFNEQRSRSFNYDNCNNTYPIDAIINLAYNHDDDLSNNNFNNHHNHHHELPPSYDEVMRQPEIYPKVRQQLQQQQQQQQQLQHQQQQQQPNGKITEEHI